MKVGYIYAVAAYGAWGLFPIFWRFLHEVPYPEIVIHRVLWSLIFFWILSKIKGFYKDSLKSLRLPTLKPLIASAILIGVNWSLYIYGVNSGHVLETSLGYFINPLVNVLLGSLILKEKLSPLKWFAVLLAAIGVLFLTTSTSSFPWLALALAFTFGTYGLIRKQIKIKPLAASCGESVILFFLSVPVIFWIHPTVLPGAENFGSNILLLSLGGAVTALPLLWFAEAATRIPLSTLGFFQYIAPSLQFCTAVFVYKENFTQNHLICFGFIWTALALFSFSLLRKRI